MEEGRTMGAPPSSAGTRTDIEKTPPAFEERDNWKHRSKKMKCGTCMVFVEKWRGKPLYKGHIIGRCRRHAPTMSGWPAVFSDDWCGDHKLDEEKI